MSTVKREDGFTLVELMAVVFIIGLLVMIATPVFLSAAERSKLNTCKANLRTLDGAIQTFAAENQRFPIGFAEMIPTQIGKIPTEPFGDTYNFKAATSTTAAYVECSLGHTY